MKGEARSSLSLIDMKEYSLQRVKKVLLLLRIWSLVKLSTMRKGYLCRMKTEQKLNTGFGTHFVQSWLLPFLVVLMKYGLNPVLGFSILGLLLEPPSLMCLTLLALLELFMLWSILIEVVETWLTWQRSIQMLS